MMVGPHGPLLIHDVIFTDGMDLFDQERIPERVVHTNAFVYIEETHNITKYCKAKVFEHTGKRTPVTI